uniref:GOLGA2L5 domain-containing protein n=1 Tax=Macrostomum lignano TaxID=282301 RepID=A0A1I8H0Q7_9PLAT
RTYSGASVASAESGLGSLHRGDSPAFHARFSTSTSTSSGRNSAVATASAAAAAAAAAAATYASASSGGMSNLPADLDELDFLSQPDGVGTACSQSSDSFSPLTVLTSTASGPLGIPGATSPYSPSAFRSTVSSHGSAAVGPLPFQSGAGGTFESPILISSSSPFANPGVDLERLQFQQEILRAQDEARRMREAMQRAQQERDDAQRQLESVRAQLRDISALAEQHSQSKDLLSLSAEELEELKQKLHRHLQTAQQLTLEDSSPPRQPGVTSASGGGGLNLSASIDSLGFSAALSTVEELSGDVTPNPGASESASLNNSVNNRFVFSRDSLQMKEQQINQQSVQSDKVEQQDKAKAEQSEQLEIS